MRENRQKIIILIGAGRSGTKFVRDILSSAPQVSCIPYDVGYIWRTGVESLSHDELLPEMLTEKNKIYIRKTILKIGRKTNPAANHIIEKSVPNCLRIEYVHKIFPEAKFIHLTRDGRAVTESAMRLWKKPPEKGYLLQKIKYFPFRNYRYAIKYILNMIKGVLVSGRGQLTWGPRYDGIDNDVSTKELIDVCAKQWQKCVSSSLGGLAKIPADYVFSIKYEEFIMDPRKVIELCQFIGIEDPDSIVSELANKVNKSNLDKWKDLLTKEEKELIEKIQDKELKALNYI